MSLNIPRPAVSSLWFLLTMVAPIAAGSKVSLAADYYRSRFLGRHLMSLAEQSPELVRVKSIGLPKESCPQMSDKICSLLEQEMHVPKNRVFIDFKDLEREMFGWYGKTF